mmetsp:Transcript_34111/g.77818  ORF Transcript_34111/g.77818 Transcript_34111/m.77818 type:complete len:637 (-) Transcript_34111:82-1992(-)
MDLSILESSGIPEGSILSVRSGPTRRQNPMPCTAPFKLPPGPWPLRMDVLALLGKSNPGSILGKMEKDGRCKVPIETLDGRQMSVTLQVYEGPAGRPKTSQKSKDMDVRPSSPVVPARDTEAEARSYLDKHRLHEFMHTLFELLLRKRPEDPYSFIADCLKEAAACEPTGLPLSFPTITQNASVSGSSTMKMTLTAGSPTPADPSQCAATRASLSTAPSTGQVRETQSLAMKSESIPPALVPTGPVELTVRTIKGKSLINLSASSAETVASLKRRLEPHLGVPSSCLQLFWWGDALPNDTALEDHGLTQTATLHVAYGSNNMKLKQLLSGASDGGLRLWSLDDAELVCELQADPVLVIWAVAVDWTGMRAVSGSAAGRVHVWDLTTRTASVASDAHADEVNMIEADWPTMQALSASGDGTVKLWDLNARKCVRTFAGEQNVYAFAVDWSIMQALGGLKTGTVIRWDLASGETLQTTNFPTIEAKAGPSAVSLDVVGNRAVHGLEDGQLVYWHLGEEQDPKYPYVGTTGKSKSTAKLNLAHYCAVRAINVHWVKVKSRALCGSDDGTLSLWNLDSSQCLARFARHVGFVWAIHVDWKQERAVSGAFDGCAKLWDLKSGECLRTLQSNSRPVRCICAG